MDAAQLMEEFGAVAEAPGGVQRLRGLVLEIAAQGKLVEQDPLDEPARLLLEAIEAQRKEKVSKRLIRKPKQLEPIEVEPYSLPSTWTWSRLGDLSFVITDGVHQTPTYLDEGVRFLSIKDISAGKLDFRNTRFISQEKHEEINKRCNPERGDILFCRIGTLGKPVIVDTDEPFSLFVSVGLIKFAQEQVLPQYLRLVLDSPLLYRQYEQVKAGGSHTDKLNLGPMPGLLIPLAPLTEQRRIVARVDELMALCDQLEEKQTRRRQVSFNLPASLYQPLAKASSAPERRSAWVRVRKHFGDLTASPDQIPALRQAILELAVRGRLVEQDPEDEPALGAGHRQTDKLASGWSMPRLEELLAESLRNGRSVQDGVAGHGFPVLRLTAFRGRTVAFQEYKIGDWTLEDAEPHLVKPGDFFVVRGNGSLSLVGRGCLAETPPFPAAFPDTAIRVRIGRKVQPLYLAYAWDSDHIRRQIEARARTTSGIYKVSQRDISEILFPLPPMAEQRRIVARVDELMSLCDELEGRLARRERVQERLAEALTAVG